MRMGTIACAALIFCMWRPALATSVAVQLETGRILIAADTHAEHDQPNSRSEDDLNCKIAPLGRFAFAQSGNIDYVPTAPQDTLPAWKSQSDVEAASSDYPNDLIAIADDWAARVKSHYTSFYFAAPQRLQGVAGKNPKNVLLVGLFIGFKDGTPTIVGETIYLNVMNLEPVGAARVIVGVRELPYSTNSITEELLSGESERAKTAQDDWTKRSKEIAPKDQDFRKLEFFIQRTAEFDPTVGKKVDVLALTPDKPPLWVQDFTCPK